ncbi:MAG: bifunctional serine/threonine-protein kinase/formylglycine-generating enzyme family protein [Planctomycetota bacterium]
MDPRSDATEGTPTPSDGEETVAVPGPASPARGLSGRRLGHYRLIEEIGHGGQGFVYRAVDERIRREVALKILPRGHAFSPAARLRFEREAEAAGRLDHSGVARVFELGEEDGVVFIAMELVKGRTLAAVIRAAASGVSWHETATRVAATAADEAPACSIGRPDESASGGPAAILEAARFIESAALALHAAHERGLVHRDVKPGNLMVREDGSACVLDFGLAQDDSGASVTLTNDGDLLGTPAYMSPEQVRAGAVRLDRRTDVYSLGVCLFEACTLVRPFAGLTRHELLEAIAHREPPSPRQIDPRLPRDLEAVILTAIDKDRDRRYATALALAEDLGRFLRREPVAARPAGPAVKTLRWIQRNPIVSALGVAVFLALVAATTIFWVKGEEARRERDRAERESRAKDLALRDRTSALAEKSLALADYERLADVKRLEAAIASADELFPPSPELLPRLLAWRERHGGLVARLEDHRRFLEALRTQALPAPDGAPSGFRFADEARQFQHDVMSALVRDLEVFATDEAGPLRSVERRIAQSREIAAATLEGEAARRWSACRARLAADARYAGLDLAPRLGLVPLGPDPASGLEEFLHWLTHAGPLPARDEAGQLVVTEELGLVLVLVPGGAFRMGCQGDDPQAPNHDPQAQPDDGPVHEVTLEPYLLSKYEMTQAQWQRAFVANPSQYAPGARIRPMTEPVDARSPVEFVSWTECRDGLRRLGLELPTEAEWERAARAGRDDRIWSGCSDLPHLRDFANISGDETRAAGFSDLQPGHADPFVLHAPVGSLAPNGFGLHDMSGNVWEWCLDAPADYSAPAGARGLRAPLEDGDDHVLRGGGFNLPARFARIAYRYANSPEYRIFCVGVRPALPLAPGS